MSASGRPQSELDEALSFNRLPFLSMNEAGLYRRYYEQSRSRLADACPNSRLAWNAAYHYRYLERGDCLLLMTDGGLFREPHACLPVGDLRREALPEILSLLEAIFAEQGWPLRLYFVDETELPLFRDLPGWQIESSYTDDLSDYVYRASDLRELRGSAYRTKRNHVNQIYRELPNLLYREIQATDAPAVCQLVREWCREKDLDCEDPLQSDALAIRELMRGAESLDLRGGLLLDGARIVALSLGSQIGDTAYIHFEKAEATYPGLFALINQVALQETFPTAEWVNREEDLGLPGLREAKESYHPDHQLKKYLLVCRRV